MHFRSAVAPGEYATFSAGSGYGITIYHTLDIGAQCHREGLEYYQREGLQRFPRHGRLDHNILCVLPDGHQTQGVVGCHCVHLFTWGSF